MQCWQRVFTVPPDALSARAAGGPKKKVYANAQTQF